jgi:hypothetical protein
MRTLKRFLTRLRASVTRGRDEERLTEDRGTPRAADSPSAAVGNARELWRPG